MKTLKTIKVLLTTLAGCALCSSCALAQPPQINLALGKTVTFSAAPNYGSSTDPDDSKQLTDGKYSSAAGSGSIWLQKGTVGWHTVPPVIITIDLGSVQPISGVSYSTAAGISDVSWPNAIFVAVSDDNKTWHAAGDLTYLSRKNGSPPAPGYANFRFVTHELHTKGRYVAIAVQQYPYIFADEIEVYKGDEAWLNEPVGGRLIPDMKNWVKDALGPAMVLHRVQQDADAVRAEVDASNLAAAQKSTFAARLDNDVAATLKMETLPPDFKAILPLNDEHRDILAMHGELLAAQGFSPLTVWKQHRYQWLPLLAVPSIQTTPQLNITMLRDQFRSDALLLTNASGKPQRATLQLKTVPRGAQNGWLQVSSVAWTDTAQGVPVADALIPVAKQNNVYTVDIPAGMTRKIWLTVDSSKVPAGAYKSTFDITAGAQHATVPFTLNVSTVAMKKPRMALSVWDYTNVPAYRGLTLQNRDAAMALMRSHYVNTPWATGIALPRPAAMAFDAQGNLKDKLDFSNLDQWIAMWPDAQRYYVYANVGNSFAGAKMETPEFNQRVGSWAKVLSAHMKQLGLQPKQLGILLVDEPLSDAQDAIIAAWAKAINAAAPELTLFEDSARSRPDQAKRQDAITNVDVLCFQIQFFEAGGDVLKTYAQDLQQQGKELWLYQATGPVRWYDPQRSYRQLAWYSFSIGGTGESFWSFGDTGGAPTSWNEYETYMTYAPAFIDKDTVYNSIHWDAVREGVEDYEELSMLEDAINASHNAAWKQHAQQILDDAVKAVTVTWDSNRDWRKKTNPDLTDTELQKVRDLLIQN
jgi:hypothetical protein